MRLTPDTKNERQLIGVRLTHILMASFDSILILTSFTIISLAMIDVESNFHTNLISCIDVNEMNNSRFSNRIDECATSRHGILFSLMLHVVNNDSIQILTFTTYKNFNLIKTRFMVAPADDQGANDGNFTQYYGFEATSRFEKHRKLIVLSKSVVKMRNETCEKKDPDKMIKLIAFRNQPEGYIFHIFSLDSMQLKTPPINLLTDKSVIQIIMDAQEINTDKKFRYIAISDPDYLFGEAAAKAISDGSVKLDEVDDKMTALPKWKGSTSLIYTIALIVFTAVLIVSCRLSCIATDEEVK